MRREIQRYLDQRPEEKLFVRLHPEWYRRLARSPQDVARIKAASDYFFGRTIGQKMDRLAERAGMLSLMMQLAQAMDHRNEPESSGSKDKKGKNEER